MSGTESKRKRKGKFARLKLKVDRLYEGMAIAIITIDEMGDVIKNQQQIMRDLIGTAERLVEHQATTRHEIKELRDKITTDEKAKAQLSRLLPSLACENCGYSHKMEICPFTTHGIRVNGLNKS